MSARVPFVFHYPALFQPRRVKESVSTMDLTATLLQIIGSKIDPLITHDGVSLYPALTGQSKAADEVFGEYMGEGTISPVVMIRRGPWKFTASLVDKPQLFNLEKDPLELENLAESADPDIKAIFERFAAEANAKWDLKQIHQDVLSQQRQRRVCFQALKKGEFEPWDYEPKEGAAKKCVKIISQNNQLRVSANIS